MASGEKLGEFGKATLTGRTTVSSSGSDFFKRPIATSASGFCWSCARICWATSHTCSVSAPLPRRWQRRTQSPKLADVLVGVASTAIEKHRAWPSSSRAPKILALRRQRATRGRERSSLPVPQHEKTDLNLSSTSFDSPLYTKWNFRGLNRHGRVDLVPSLRRPGYSPMHPDPGRNTPPRNRCRAVNGESHSE